MPCSLHDALLDGDIACILTHAALAAPEDKEATLVRAAERGERRVVDALLAAGTRLDANVGGSSPLTVACWVALMHPCPPCWAAPNGTRFIRKC